MERLLPLVLVLFLVLVWPPGRDNVLVHADINGVDDKDSKGLGNLIDSFELELPSDSPCLEGEQWDWVVCSTDDPPRIKELYLNSSSLSGPIPDFSTMDTLETIDMHDNNLTGTIPSFLGDDLPNLTKLDLSYNDLTGSVPSSLVGINPNVTGNPKLCITSHACNTPSPSTVTEPPIVVDPPMKSNELKKILAAVIPIVVLFLAVLAVYLVYHQRKKWANAGTQGDNDQTATISATVIGTPIGAVMMGQMDNERNQMKVMDQNNAQNYNTMGILGSNLGHQMYQQRPSAPILN